MSEDVSDPEPRVLYLCDRRRCDVCSAEAGWCTHTTDPRHAVNFRGAPDGSLWERDAPVDPDA